MKDTTATCLGIIVGIVIAVIVGSIANGWALSVIWNWFMPTLFDLPSLTIAQAIGVSMVIALFVGVKNKSNDNDYKNKSFGDVLTESLALFVITALFTVGFAWIVLQFAF